MRLVPALIAGLLAADVADAQRVVAKLHAAWQRPSLLAEALEFVDSVDPESYFGALINITSTTLQASTEKTTYNNVLAQLSAFATPLRQAMLKMSLAGHEFAPKIQAYSHIYRGHLNTLHTRHVDMSKNSFSCAVLVIYDEQGFCDLDTLTTVLSTGSENTQSSSDRASPEQLPFEHVYHANTITKAQSWKPMIVYGDLQDPSFNHHYTQLVSIAEKYQLSIWFRYNTGKLDDGKSQSMVWLSGYGVELAVKSTEYKVQDDRHLAKEQMQKQDTDGIIPQDDIVEPLEIGEPTIQKLSDTEMPNVGLRVAYYITRSANPLKTMLRISQDFPRYAHHFGENGTSSAVVTKVPKSFTSSITSNTRVAYTSVRGASAFWLNGIQMPIGKLQPFGILDVLRKEIQTLAGLKQILPHANTQELVSFLTSDKLLMNGAESTDEEDSDIFTTMFYVKDDIIVRWLNNLEKDSRYREWSSSILDLLRPTYPGQMRQISRNIFNTICVLNMSRVSDITIFTELIEFVQQKVPIRFGVVPMIDASTLDSNESLAGRIFHILVRTEGLAGLGNFFSKLGGELMRNPNRTFAETTAQTFSTWEKKKALSAYKSLDEALASQDIKAEIEATTVYLRRLTLRDGKSHLFVNGKHVLVSDNWQQQLLQIIRSQTEYLQRKLYVGELSKSINVFEYFMSLSSTWKNRNELLFVSEENPLRVIDLIKFGLPSNIFVLTDDVTKKQQYQCLLVIIADLDSLPGIALAVAAIKYATNLGHALSFIHHLDNKTSEQQPSVFRKTLIKIAQLPAVPEETKGRLVCLGKAGRSLNDASTSTEASELTCLDSVKQALEELEFNAAHSHLLDAPLRWKEYLLAGKSYVTVNGRIVGPITSKSFEVDDFEQLMDLEMRDRNTFVYAAAQASDLFKPVLTPNHSKPLWLLSSIYHSGLLRLQEKSSIFYDKLTRSKQYKLFECNDSCFEIGDAIHAEVRLDIVVNPVSEDAQKWSTILDTLLRMGNVYARVVLLPDIVTKELPVNRFYRYAFEAEPRFSEEGERLGLEVSFSGLPREPIYTMGLEVPGKWLTSPVHSVHDLDNIKLANLGAQETVRAEYELSTILVEGHARDTSSGAPPSGLQFVLQSHAADDSSARRMDTIVMANLGYFQLKASPGVWELSIRKGRSDDIYRLDSIGDLTVGSPSDKRLFVASFEGATIFPKVSKRPGQEKEDVLQSVPQTGDDVWSSLKTKFTQYTGLGGSTDKRVINVFSVASGHLYERFLSIMFVSVLRHTKNPVKFWLIENFLSPSFREFVPEMAKEYGFQYEFVTYKWPSWLRAQKEKQRIIWGYKILFLDVLFPLDVDKVIFVDADQIVRTDLSELLDVDLKGAPYGYTPFCNSRKNMDGFRFWKTGYWKDYLRGRPYHISALYVVDLSRFRQMAAGDRLRGQYHSLSADPNSLANLDQDLPNNMQDIVPIHSLPLEWLWCETWCDDASLARAKTIDLCNNPMTKEPKLERAKRLIPEWEEYDEEVQRLQERLAKITDVSTKKDQSATTTPHMHQEL